MQCFEHQFTCWTRRLNFLWHAAIQTGSLSEIWVITLGRQLLLLHCRRWAADRQTFFDLRRDQIVHGSTTACLRVHRQVRGPLDGGGDLALVVHVVGGDDDA